MSRKLLLPIVLALAILSIAGSPTSAYAQAQGDKKITVDLKDVDIRDGLKTMFKDSGKSYTIATDVQGTVTAYFKEVTFDTALLNLLKQVDATYTVEGGVYDITKRKEVIPPPIAQQQPVIPPSQRPPVTRFKIRHADPELIYMILTGQANFGTEPEISTKDLSSLLGNGNNRGQGSGNQSGFFLGRDNYYYYIGDTSVFFGGGGNQNGNGGFGSSGPGGGQSRGG